MFDKISKTIAINFIFGKTGVNIMAWNQPGNGGKTPQDPWKNKQNNQPPDLDELLKKLQEKLVSMFGGGPKKKSNDAGFLGVISIAATVFLFVWIFAGIYRVEQAEQALVSRFGKYHEMVGAGLHWNPYWIDQVVKVNTEQVSSYSHKSTMLTEDQNIVDVELEVQYRIQEPRKYYFEINDSLGTLRQATESALRHVVGGSPMDKVITEGRQVIAHDAVIRLQEYLDRYRSGLLITKVNVEDAHPPKEVKEAFDDVIKAREDEDRLKNEAQAYANGVIPEARGAAQRQIEEANAYKGEVVSRSKGEADRFSKLLTEYRKSPEVTRQRLYIESMEAVFSRSSKVFMDLESSNSMIYLPLDKLISNERVPANFGGSVKERQLKSSQDNLTPPANSSLVIPKDVKLQNSPYFGTK